MLRTYRTCNSTIRFSKYEFYNKKLGGVTLFRVIPGVTWTQPIYVCIYIYIYINCWSNTNHIYYKKKKKVTDIFRVLVNRTLLYNLI